MPTVYTIRRILLFVLFLGNLQLTLHAAEKRPNVVFILADDLGYTDIACYGSKYYETPHIDRLAANGVRFTSGYTCGPNCQPTRAALLSGQYNPRTGIYTVGGIDRFDWQSRPLRPVDNVQNLPLDKITLPQTLKQAGYATGMFGKWHLGNNGKHHPGQRGFDEAIVSAGAHFNFKTDPPTDYPEGTYLADFLTDKAVDFIRRHQEQPFFLYLPHFGVHAPHQAKPELINKFKTKTGVDGHKDPAYAAMIASVDESVGRIVATLEELKLADNTLVVFTSDNGGVGGYEREGIQGGSITDNAPLHGGKGMLYEGGIRVPYIFRWASKITPGGVNETPINTVDLYPTLLEITSSKAPADYPLDGHSYAELLTSVGKTTAARDALYWHFPGYLGAGQNTWRTTPAGAIRSGDWKLIEFFEDNRLELYNLKSDIGERQNLAQAHPEKAAELLKQLKGWRQEIGAQMPTPHTAEKAPATGKQKKKRQKKNNDD
ncbi:MAG: sulfatase [Planctomycetota bacterium]